MQRTQLRYNNVFPVFSTTIKLSNCVASDHAVLISKVIRNFSQEWIQM